MGGIETPYTGELRTVIPSPRDVKTYDLKPEMSAFGVIEVVIKALNEQTADLIIVNLANCDMVGHTGVIPAAVKAVETIDTCVAKMLEALQLASGQGLLLADHGNAEQMIASDGTPYTAHTTFPVPLIAVGDHEVSRLASGGALCDVAPTVLDMMKLTKPAEMSGISLLIHNT